MHRHDTIVTNETFVNSSVGPCRLSSDRLNNANGDRVVHMITSGINYEFIMRYASGYGYAYGSRPLTAKFLSLNLRD